MGIVEPQPIGDLLREWRRRRRMSQLDLAGEADISTRHLSFLETGRARPSRDMVLHLAECLEIPLRERNVLLISAGYAPAFPERTLADPALQAARKAIDLVLAGLEPYPALAIDAVGPSLRPTTQSRLCSLGSIRHYCSPPSMCFVSAYIRQDSRRGSLITPNGARICSPACAARSMSPPTQPW